MYGYVYKTTNLLNGKIYIGRHKASKYDKWYYGSGNKLLEDIDKFGRDNFSVEILCWCNSDSELNEFEKKFIAEYNSQDPNIGYNIQSGGTKGDWLDDLSLEEATAYREHMSQLSKDGVCGNKGKHLSPEHRKRIGDSNRGKVHSLEWVKHSSESLKGLTPWNKGLDKSDPRVQKCIRKPGVYTHSEETRVKMREKAKHRDLSNYGKHAKGRIWICNGEHSLMIYPNELDSYIVLGYTRGRGGWSAYAKKEGDSN